MSQKSNSPPEIKVGMPSTYSPPLRLDSFAPKAPPLQLDTEGVAIRRLSLVPPEVSRVLLLLSGLLAPAAAYLQDYWNLTAAAVSMLLAALCGVSAPVPRFTAGRLPVSASLVAVAGGGSLALLNEASTLAEGWPKALALAGAWLLSYVAGKPVGVR